MPGLPELEKQFLETLATLGSALHKLTIVGGWCPYLYTKYLWHEPLPPIPTTLDIDLGVSETGALAPETTVYAKLKQAGLVMERLYEKEETPIEFISRRNQVDLKLEFITSFWTSDDTLNRFLGKELACNRLEAFEFLLEHTLQLEVPYPGGHLTLSVPEPAAFMYHKGLTFITRSEEFKRNKDLFYLYFILRYAPRTQELINRLAEYRNHDFFDHFRQNIMEYLGDVTKPGYAILGQFLRSYQDARTIDKEITQWVQHLHPLLGPRDLADKV